MTSRVGIRLDGDVDAATQDAPPHWELVPAPFGSGVCLVCVTHGACRAWTPPGVRLLSGDDEKLAQWRRSWFSSHGEPSASEACTLTQVIADVPSEFESWATEATVEAVELLELFSDGEDSDDEAVAAAQATALRRDLNRVRIRHLETAPTEPTTLEDPTSFVDACKALSDCDFATLVRRLISAEWQVAINHRQGALGTDVLVGEALGRRHVFHVSHDPRTPAWTWERPVDRMCAARERHDVTWWVTSQIVKERTAPTPRSDGGIIGAVQLLAMLRANPTVEREQLKLRLAGAAHASDVEPSLRTLPAELPRIAETVALGEARERLWTNRALIISGCAGIGKTTLAQMLVSEAALNGYSVFPCDREAEQPASRVVFMDDVPDPGMLRPWLSRARRVDDTLLVAITHEQPPRSWDRYVLHLGEYDQRDRSRIIYNQLWPMLLRRPPIAPSVLVAVCTALLALREFTPRAVVERLRALLREADGGQQTLALTPPLREAENDDPLLDRIRRGWRETDETCDMKCDSSCWS